MMYIYFYLLSFSIIGFGFFVSKILKIKNNCLGALGLLGISFIALISYTTTLFISHDYFFNTLIHFFGIILFLLYLKKANNFKKEFFVYFIFFTLLLIFISIGKNHDDFPYYHFPYAYLLTEFSHPIGLGQLNNGFRSPSSIFFINSLFYLPGVEYYLFHFTPAFILGFANIILYKIIVDQKLFEKFKFFNFLALLSFCLINIFFYRLAEHGTDRSGMILVLIAIIYLYELIKQNIINNKDLREDKLKFFAILICFVVSIKPFYLIYLSLFFLVIYNKDTRYIFFKLIFSNSFFYCLSLILFTFLFTFLNSGCIIFPLEKTCFSDLSWSISKVQINDVKIWFELWSKAGATPNYIVENRINYISNFNWFINWVENYFFNKVTDYILGITFLIIIFFFLFRNKSYKIKKFKFKKIDLIYLFLVIFFTEWFLNHPTLRYGGYHIIALIFFVPISLYLTNYNINYKDFIKKAYILIIITSIIFLFRNISRLSDEYKQYNYNLIDDTNFQFIGGDKKFHLRYNNHITLYSNQYQTKKIFGKNFLILSREN